jgi:hypothetical protein
MTGSTSILSNDRVWLQEIIPTLMSPDGDTRTVTGCVPSVYAYCRRDEARDTARQVATSTKGVIQRPVGALSPHEGNLILFLFIGT